MKKNLAFLLTLSLVCFFSQFAIAEDIYLYYSTKDVKGLTMDTKIYAKNGDARIDVSMDMVKMKMTTSSLVLKKNPNEIIVLNSLSKSYTKRVIPKKNPNLGNYTITVIGKEKIGIYNCTHVRVKNNNKSFDMWCTKDIPILNLGIVNNQANINKKLTEELEKKGISGMMVKMVYFQPGAITPKLTMELKKYETKPLNASLFKIPSDYIETVGNPRSNISPAQRNEMMKRIQEQLKKKQ